MKKVKVVELFAGVGGFRLGLEAVESNIFSVDWANQWEPSKKAQDAYNCYVSNFEKEESTASNTDISKVSNEIFRELSPDLLVGGFPCQDYSVARSKSGEKGIEGKKGVLFWEIYRALESGQPNYVLLENVDRLLKSPSSQRGRDFAIMLRVFHDLGYHVEWRVINAAEYGFAQRRRRVFIFAYKSELNYAKEIKDQKLKDVVYKTGFFASKFPVKSEPYKDREVEGKLPEDIVQLSDEYSFDFYSSGIMIDGLFYTSHTSAVDFEPTPIGDILQTESEVDEKYYLTDEQIEKFSYLRGPKKKERVSKTGHKYIYSEGGMSPVDELGLPGRTMLTSEGSINRSTHIIETNGRKRFITPIEAERLNGFPDNWTEGLSDRMRYFTMGNALVVGLVTIMGERLSEIIQSGK